MLNMIKLDWLGMKYYHVRIIILPLMIVFMGFFNELFVIPVIAFMMLSFSVNPFAVEEKGKLDNLYLTLPVTRNDIVNARFGLSLIMEFAGLAVGTVVTIIMSSLLYGRTIGFEHTFKADFNSVFLLICSSLLFYAIMNLSMFPILFKIGYAKGKTLGFFIPLGISIVLIYAVFFAVMFSDSVREFGVTALEWSLNNTILTAVIMLGAAALILAISYMLSRRLYAKREF